MIASFEPIWRAMEQQAQERPGHGLLRRRISSSVDDGLFLAYDPEAGARVFLIEVTGRARRRATTQDWGKVSLARLHIEGSPGEVLALSIRDQTFQDVFTALTTDLYTHLSPLHGQPEAGRVLEERLEMWRKLFENTDSGLGWEAQRGLFGELHFMRRHLLDHWDASDSVDAWYGPEHGLHDFSLTHGTVEVKVSGRREPRAIKISGEDQLNPAGRPALHVYYVELDATETTGETLPELVDHVRAILAQKGGMNTFAQKLVKAGYRDADRHLYPQRHTPGDEHLFEITDSFPKIIHPPQGVFAVQYSVLLSACLQFATEITPRVRTMTAVNA